MKWISLFSFILMSQYSIGQTNWLNYTHTHHIVDLVELEEGFWLGSEGGLCYYNVEENTENYYNQGNSVLPSNYVVDLFYSSENELWIATKAGLSRWKNGILENTSFEYGGGKINETLDGKIIYVKQSGFFIQREELEFEKIEYPDYIVGVGGLEVDPDNGAIYLYSNNFYSDSHLAIWKDNEWTISNMENTYDSSMAMDHNNTLWLANGSGLQFYEDGNWVVAEKDGFGVSLDKPKLYVNREGEIIVFNQTSPSRLWVWDGTELEEIAYESEYESEFNYFIRPSEKHDGVYYGSNLEKGFYSFTTNEISEFKSLAQSPLLSNYVSSILHHSDGSHYIFMRDRIQIIESGNWRELSMPFDIDRWIKQGYIREDGVIWIRDFTNLWKYENEEWSNIELPSDLSANLDLLEMKDDGTFWIQSELNLARFQNNQWTVYTTEQHGITSPYVNSMLIEPITGDLWVAAVNGLVHFDGESWETFNCEVDFNRAQNIAFGNDGVYVLFDDCLKLVQDGNLIDIPLPLEDNIAGYSSQMVYNQNSKDLFISDYRVLAVLNEEGEWTLHSRPEARIYTDVSNDLSIDNNDNLWMSGTVSGICVFNGEGITSLSVNPDDGNESEISVAIYPSLISDNRVYVKSQVDQECTIVISDASGRVIYRKTIDLRRGIQNEIEMPQIGSNLCFVSIMLENEVLTQKVIRIQE